MKNPYLHLCLAFLILFSTGCGYHFGQGSQLTTYRTISVPYVIGDWDGNLTSAVIRQISQSSTLSYVRNNGSLILRIEIIDIDDENIGFRYDRHKDGDEKKSILPDETRLSMLVEVQVIEAATGKVIVGPARLSGYVDFDHYYYSNRDAVNIFSLGQFTDIDEAEDAANKPLNTVMAIKIVDYLNNPRNGS